MNCNVQPSKKKVDFMVVGEQTSKGRKRIYFKMVSLSSVAPRMNNSKWNL